MEFYSDPQKYLLFPLILSDNKRPTEKGIFPKSYVQILESVKVKNDFVVKRSEIVEEITRVLLEWRDLLNHFYLVRKLTNISFLYHVTPANSFPVKSRELPANMPQDARTHPAAVADSVRKSAC